MYSLGADVNEAYCLVPDRGGWIVYYSERGNRNNARHHDDEQQACADLLARMLRQVARDDTW